MHSTNCKKYGNYEIIKTIVFYENKSQVHFLKIKASNFLKNSLNIKSVLTATYLLLWCNSRMFSRKTTFLLHVHLGNFKFFLHLQVEVGGKIYLLHFTLLLFWIWNQHEKEHRTETINYKDLITRLNNTYNVKFVNLSMDRIGVIGTDSNVQKTFMEMWLE